MTIVKWNDFIMSTPDIKGPVSMSIGVFDGLHRGHQKLLKKVISYHTENSILLTFRNNPRVFFKDRSYPGDIFTVSQKIEAFSDMGIDMLILIDFSSNFSKLSGRDFLNLIVENCELSYLILGNNFRCGHEGLTTSYEAKKILKSKNVLVDIVKMTKFQDQLISSTRIRDAISLGDFKETQKMLGRVFSLDIANIPQIIRDKTIIIEKKNINQVLPPQGQYVVRVGTSEQEAESDILLNASEILVPLQRMQNLEYIKFI